MGKGEHFKSKQRINDHGEVFTSEREVNSMLNLVQAEAERIESKFLEPACGTGNFLKEVFARKLKVVLTRYSKSQREFEFYSCVCASSIYGIDLLEDNIYECRKSLYKMFEEVYINKFGANHRVQCLQTVKYFLEKNIIHGNALTLTEGNSNDKPIIFSEWSFLNQKVKRRDYEYRELSAETAFPGEKILYSDQGTRAFIPIPLNDYPLKHYLLLTENA